MNVLRTTDQLYEKADALILTAEQEKIRAQDDVVTHLICNNARVAIYHLLKGYLLQRNIPILAPASIASLQQQCQAVDPRFNVLNLDHMPCRYESPGRYYCIERDIVEKCLLAAQEVQALVMTKVAE